eukprot:7780424-Pyramimonas_sp.AAC.1
MHDASVNERRGLGAGGPMRSCGDSGRGRCELVLGGLASSPLHVGCPGRAVGAASERVLDWLRNACVCVCHLGALMRGIPRALDVILGVLDGLLGSLGCPSEVRSEQVHREL